MATASTLLTNLRVDSDTGVVSGFTRRYEKRFDELAGVFSDDAAWRDLVEREPDAVAYEVFECRASDEPGDLVFGTTILHPAVVGDEFSMTRGHGHQRADRTEFYHCLTGQGALVLHGEEGPARAEPMNPGGVVYVPPRTRHRAVNVGDSPLSFTFCYPADAGQDYEVIERQGGMPILIVADRAGGWQIRPNPRYVGGTVDDDAAGVRDPADQA